MTTWQVQITTYKARVFTFPKSACLLMTSSKSGITCTRLKVPMSKFIIKRGVEHVFEVYQETTIFYYKLH